MTTEQCWKTHSNYKAKAATQWKKAVLKQQKDRLPIQFDIVFFLFYITEILQAEVWLYDPLVLSQHRYFDYEGDITVGNIN